MAGFRDYISTRRIGPAGGEVVWDDLRFPASAVRLGGGAAASEAAYKDGLVIEFVDNADSYLYFIAQLPHSWKEGSDIEVHIHWTLPVGGSGAGVENIKWDFTYSAANIGGTFPNSSSLSITRDVQNDVADHHRMTRLGYIINPNLEISNCIICSLKRDTGVADNTTLHAYIVELDFHIQLDTEGSLDQLSKT